MSKTLLIGSLIFIGFACQSFAQLPDGGLYNSPDVSANVTGFWGDQGDGTYRNPVLAVDFSDPDPIRVGDDFYMAASTFESAPGVTILHSRDLVNWEIIGGVFDHLGDFSEEFLSHKKGRYNLGVYAPSLRYHDGKFYVYVNLVSDGMCVATAENPAGPWKTQFLKDRNGKPLKVKQWTDPCPVWDDATGKAYLATSRAGGWQFWYSYLFEMTPDGTQLLDADADYMNQEDICYEWSKGGGTLYSPHHSSEGNKIYKRGDYYYLMHIEFFTKTAGTYVYRSKNIYGTKPDGTPGKPGDLGLYDVYRLDAPTPMSATVDSTDVMKIYKGPLHEQKLPGQGGLVDTPDGRWFYIAQFTDGNAGGRQPHLVPVTWINDWPVVGVNPDDELHGQMVWQYRKPIDGYPICLPQGSDDFVQETLHPRWCWNHQPDDAQWSLKDRRGFMRLYAVPTHTGSNYLFDVNNLLNQRSMRSDTTTVTIRVDVSKMSDGQQMGLAHFNGGVSYGWAGIEKQKGVLYLKSDHGTVQQEWGSPIRHTTAHPELGEPIARKTRYLYLQTTWGMADEARFWWSLDGQTFHPYALRYHMTSGNFRGDMTGIFTFNNRAKGYIDVDYFDYQVVNVQTGDVIPDK